MAVVTITSPATFEIIDPAGFGTCCGLVPLVQRVTPRRKRKGDAWVLVNCSNADCLYYPEDSGVFAGEGDILKKWERYRNADPER